MGPTLLCELGLFLLCTLLCTGHAQDAVLTIEPNCCSFFIGEFVTFMCDMNEGADTDWEYKLNKDGREFVPYNTHKYYRLDITSTGYSGEYQCFGSRKSSHDTKRSNTVSVTVSADKPRATLTAGTTIIPVGGSVTLTCSVGRSAEWKYEWFRRTQRTTEVQIRRDDQPNRVIRVSQGGIYRCRGRRGDPVYYTDISDEVIIEITFSNKVAVKQQQHNWTQIFSGETITLTCEVEEGGEPTEWEYEWRGPRQTTQWTHSNSLTFRVSESSSGDYMCKSRLRDDSYSSTEWSEAFTLSASIDQPKAEITSDMRDNPVGGSVILSCSVNQSSGWKYYWYRDENSSEPLATEDAVFPSNGQIRVSQEGLYRCRGGRGDPVYYTEDSQSVRIDKNKLSKHENSSFLILLIAGVVCGVLLILLLLLLFRFKKSKDSGFIRTQSTNQSSATNHMINQDEAQHSQHTSPPEDDSLLYAQVFHNKAKAKRDNDDSLLYAQVSYRKPKAKRDKGKSAPAAAEETVYSEVRTQTMPNPL
ncbi:platelet endothelial cell adhesion molecule-like isoform X2 [Archocentrus centrarchus]|uniref:platelet endothelial cell adhesion molecule-like isoform X2 n=1 Tax=Archocentrus centrarchus TaxID=63155 RepID=UPI0011EA4B3A|nr:platelet endothelial cell adhesion molecule-like isoform X2 [Archocentrus centrarchus]